MAKNRGLGRGLDALIPDNTNNIIDGVKQEENGERVVKLSLADIDPNRTQPRRSFDNDALQDLAQSMRNVGVLQPILVSAQSDGRYQIIAGERRWRAARLAGLSKIPAIIKDMDASHTREAALIENLQRDDLNPIDEAAAIKQLMEDFGETQDQIAQRLGKSRSAVANSVRLLTLPQEIIDFVRNGALSAGHARALAAIDDTEKQVKLAKLAIQNGWTVRQMEAAAQQQQTRHAVHTQHIPELKDMERMAREAFGTKAQLSGSLERGKLTLSYFSRDDLDRIYEALEYMRSRDY